MRDSEAFFCACLLSGVHEPDKFKICVCASDVRVEDPYVLPSGNVSRDLSVGKG